MRYIAYIVYLVYKFTRNQHGFKGWEAYWKEFGDACALTEGMGKIKAINKRYSGCGLKSFVRKGWISA